MKYIATESKRAGKITTIDYFQKCTGIFNKNGMISAEELERMKVRAQTGEKNLWHGFISVDEENSHKIDSPEKCIHLIKRTFDSFFRDIGFDPKNIDLICALHLDRPKHLHIHFEFWEKEPKQKYRKRETEYRHKGKIPQSVIDKMHERLNMFLADDPDTKIRKLNLRLFVKEQGIWYFVSSAGHWVIDMDELMYKLNPRGVDCKVDMPRLRWHDDTERRFRYLHQDIPVTIRIVEKAFQSDNVFKIQNGHRWIINYDQLEREVYKILGCAPNQ